MISIIVITGIIISIIVSIVKLLMLFSSKSIGDEDDHYYYSYQLQIFSTHIVLMETLIVMHLLVHLLLSNI